MKILLSLCLSVVPLATAAQAPAGPDIFQPLHFLEQNWEANTHGSAGVESKGTYTFRRELGGHVLSRQGKTKSGCKGPSDFDCEHGDLLYVYQEGAGTQLKAIYLDNEGHVIHYDVSSPAAGSAVFLSSPKAPGPQFRLTYELRGSVLFGKFESRMPGASEWQTYLEWNGSRR